MKDKLQITGGNVMKISKITKIVWLVKIKFQNNRKTFIKFINGHIFQTEKICYNQIWKGIKKAKNSSGKINR